MARHFLGIGALSAFLAVAAGAFGAHALTGIVSADRLAVWETAARYQMYHALGTVRRWRISPAQRSRPCPAWPAGCSSAARSCLAAASTPSR